MLKKYLLILIILLIIYFMLPFFVNLEFTDKSHYGFVDLSEAINSGLIKVSGFDKLQNLPRPTKKNDTITNSERVFCTLYFGVWVPKSIVDDSQYCSSDILNFINIIKGKINIIKNCH